ncbi:hypothetical protein EIN_318950 [Entamoeba invadens IP1]|uniref:Uncharacterized protein n=1 Tax=Entamoeba invadens IP1 TaxID=370355 RepID=A0A0A1U5G8_ENTIV|nr:hypothetical protein EIN_318950 [Entamoeba invadens IP1]ELP87016.1 hypothetical protein EIN_318950 [Entamoeba invadens IP1]|eukprot:XP_004253787.1 hypothetical protein EIN_318950 [Entamoeba invadens IP1]
MIHSNSLSAAMKPTPKDKKREEILHRDQLRNLIKSVDKRYELDKTSIQPALKDVVEDFLETSLCDLLDISKFRQEEKISTKDAVFYYKKFWDFDIGTKYPLSKRSNNFIDLKYQSRRMFIQNINSFKQCAHANFGEKGADNTPPNDKLI